ncbi:hypothetical protein H5410_030462 [Solanum commersonii]|uniref:Uncharacterized protein n=1 Tax=Solanum commersonii TaxID=4109 RepID=A0A9J5YIR5_SOLCO|nr:hypothetical protein H5410_030462 [Solanum commersonii]
MGISARSSHRLNSSARSTRTSQSAMSGSPTAQSTRRNLYNNIIESLKIQLSEKNQKEGKQEILQNLD